jgi:hypothetical protein
MLVLAYEGEVPQTVATGFVCGSLEGNGKEGNSAKKVVRRGRIYGTKINCSLVLTY